MNTFKIAFLITFFIMSVNYSNAQINEAVKFKITDSNGNTDEVLIRLSNEATNQFDPFWDAWKVFTQNDMVPSLYSETNDNEPVAINAIPVMTIDTVVVLQMRAKIVGGDYLMETEQLGTFPDNIKMAIKDLESGDVYELNQNQSFNFNVNVNPNNDFSRFEVFYSVVSQVEIVENNITVTNSGSDNWHLELISVAQNTIQENNIGTEEYWIDSLNVGNYMLIVTDNYNLVDTIHFTIDFEPDSVDDEPEIDASSIVDRNSLINCNLVKYQEGYMLDLSNSSLNDELMVYTYSLSGQVLNLVKVTSNENVYIEVPSVQSYYLIVLKYKDEYVTYRVSGI